MRSVMASAWFISSKASLRVCPASSVKPQLSCIFECRKYWLIAVNSLVNCSFSNFRTSGSPFIFVAPNDTVRADHASVVGWPARLDRGRERLHNLVHQPRPGEVTRARSEEHTSE